MNYKRGVGIISSIVRRRFSNDGISIKLIHPSLKKAMDNIAKSRIKTTPSLATLHVLGCGAKGLPRALYFFTDHSRYLFNCGEGTQRLGHEYKLKLSRLEHVFLTSAKWDCIGGLPGMSLTLQDIGNKLLTLHGPPGVEELYNATQKFVVLNKMKIVKAPCDVDFEDSSMCLKYVLLESDTGSITNENESDPLKEYNVEPDDTDYYSNELAGRRHVREPEMKRLLLSPRKEKFHAMCYICRLKPRLGTLDLAKCVEKGIKPGPLLGVLKSGEDVTLPDGTIVKANDVKTPDSPGPVFIIVDVPDVSYLDSLSKKTEFFIHQEKSKKNPEDTPAVIVHFTPDEVFKTKRYQDFVESFSPSTSHLIINENCNCIGSTAVQRVQSQLNLINSEIFPILPEQSEENELDLGNTYLENIHYSKTLTTFQLRPEVKLDRSCEVTLNIDEYIKEVLVQDDFNSSLKTFHDTVKTLEVVKSKDVYPKIVFFGTGSCIPNKTRNTSGIMLHIDENNLMLFDCGEGTLGQMVRFYGRDKIDSVLKKLKGVFISHLHADHHIGLINVLLQRKKTLLKNPHSENANKDFYLIAPKQIMPWLCVYDKQFERILPEFTLIPNSSLANLSNEYIDPSVIANVKSLLNIANISSVETCGVRHCPNAFAIAVCTKENKKISYSGDSLPCTSFVNLGSESDIMIHEATMEDELANEALLKFHSTTEQALGVAMQANAKHTIFTHFSQRYAKVPRLSAKIEEACRQNNVGLAFDNMEVSYGNLSILPHMYPTLKALFAEHYELLESKALKRALQKEKVTMQPRKMKANRNREAVFGVVE